jgi:ubiquinone/menaquinone biosynthesis C-methylase UbiE
MHNNQETFETWNKIASLYASKFMTLDIYNKSYDHFLNLINSKNPTIFEIGCGPGNITKYLLENNESCHVFAVDVAPNMIEHAIINTSVDGENSQRASFRTMDCRFISTIESTFDAIIVGFCLPYLSQIESIDFIADCSKLLNNDGIFYLSFVEGNPSDSGYQVGSSGDRIYFNFHRLTDIELALKQNHFNQLEVIHVAYEKSDNSKEIHTIVIAQKKNI